MRAIPHGAVVVSHAIAALAITFGFVAAMLASAGPAWAHAARIASDPAEDAELAQAPARVSATFNEPMQQEFASMAVIGPDGAQWSDGQPAVDGAMISVGVRTGAPAGEYTVNYRATSADGHVVSGSWSYRLTVAAPAPAVSPTTSTTPPATTTAAGAAPQDGAADDGPPVWPFVTAATALVAIGAVWAVRRRT